MSNMTKSVEEIKTDKDNAFNRLCNESKNILEEKDGHIVINKKEALFESKSANLNLVRLKKHHRSENSHSESRKESKKYTSRNQNSVTPVLGPGINFRMREALMLKAYKPCGNGPLSFSSYMLNISK